MQSLSHTTGPPVTLRIFNGSCTSSLSSRFLDSRRFRRCSIPREIQTVRVSETVTNIVKYLWWIESSTGVLTVNYSLVSIRSSWYLSTLSHNPRILSPSVEAFARHHRVRQTSISSVMTGSEISVGQSAQFVAEVDPSSGLSRSEMVAPPRNHWKLQTSNRTHSGWQSPSTICMLDLVQDWMVNMYKTATKIDGLHSKWCELRWTSLGWHIFWLRSS